MAFCKLSHTQLAMFEESGERPNCLFHHHMSYKKACIMQDNDEAFIVSNLRIVVVYDCVDRYILKTKPSAGYLVKQLCSV